MIESVILQNFVMLIYRPVESPGYQIWQINSWLSLSIESEISFKFEGFLQNYNQQ